MVSAWISGALLGAIASSGNALPIDATAGGPGCTKTSCPFSFTSLDATTWEGMDSGTCAEVDAAARMPDDIWNNQSAVTAHVDATVKYYTIRGFKLTNSLCQRAGHIPGNIAVVDWTSPRRMEATCWAVCGCIYPACPDVPDDPSKGQYCSLCGPKFNEPIIATLFQPGASSLNECAPQFGQGGSVCVKNPEEKPISTFSWSTGQNRAACQARCDFMDRGGCCQFSSVPQGQYKMDCYFYPEGSSAPNTTVLSEQTLPCIQPPPPPPSVCANGQQRFGPGNYAACQTGPNSPKGVFEPIVRWENLSVAQAFRSCEAEGKPGCCHYRTTTGLTRFIAGGVSVEAYGYPDDMTAACSFGNALPINADGDPTGAGGCTKTSCGSSRKVGRTQATFWYTGAVVLAAAVVAAVVVRFSYLGSRGRIAVAELLHGPVCVGPGHRAKVAEQIWVQAPQRKGPSPDHPAVVEATL